MFEDWQGINPMVISYPWSEDKNKKLFVNIKM